MRNSVRFGPLLSQKLVVLIHTFIQRLNESPKIIFSHSLTEASWKPFTIEKGNPIEILPKMKIEPGKDMVVIGSGSLVASFATEGLVDEYRIRIRPIILGGGKPLFIDRNTRNPLKLVSSQAFDNGVLGLH
jgi:dihydrofolate reductase